MALAPDDATVSPPAVGYWLGNFAWPPTVGSSAGGNGEILVGWYGVYDGLDRKSVV